MPLTLGPSKDIWAQRPSRPIYKYRIPERKLEELIEDAVQLYQLEKEGSTTAELYAAGVKSFVFEDVAGGTPPGTRPDSVSSELDMKVVHGGGEKATSTPT